MLNICHVALQPVFTLRAKKPSIKAGTKQHFIHREAQYFSVEPKHNLVYGVKRTNVLHVFVTGDGQTLRPMEQYLQFRFTLQLNSYST